MSTLLPPSSWGLLSAATWLVYSLLRRDGGERRFVLWGLASSAALAALLAMDPSFQGWGDVYFFCGRSLRYCTCGFRWNAAGWAKAAVLWNWVLSASLGVQRVLITVGLCGLLPGEEVVTRESFISIAWRLVPYLLNAWEAQWGAEVSSMLYELPHFALELLLILPTVQILASRMKTVLLLPSVNAALPPGREALAPEAVAAEYVPNVLRGCWERRPEQRRLWARIRANRRIISFSCLLVALAAANALVLPLALESAILDHPDAAAMQAAGRLPAWQGPDGLAALRQQLQQGQLVLGRSVVVEQAVSAAAAAAAARARATAGTNSSSAGEAAAEAAAAAARVYASEVHADAGPWQHDAGWADAALVRLAARVQAYTGAGACPDMTRLQRNLLKHHQEILRMQDPQHRATIPLVEAALALMRLSTEKILVLLSLFVSFVLWHDPPAAALRFVALNARVSAAFARLLLHAFPAVCWLYGAGVAFSMFVSVVFWGGPILQAYEFARTSLCSVFIRGLRPATRQEVQRMGDSCAICWCEMTAAAGAAVAAAAGGEGGDAAAAAGPAAASAGAGSGAAAGAEPACERRQLAAGLAAGGGSTPTAAAAAAAAGPAVAVAAAAGAPDADGEGVLYDPAAPPSPHGFALPCSHAYHAHCLSQWLQQCRSQGGSSSCPMCQAEMQLEVRWHVLRALWRRHTGAAAAAAVGDDGGGGGAAAGNNYLLRHQPGLAGLLADLPQLLAPENVQLLAEVQELRAQRAQLVEELQLRRRQLRELAARQAQMQRQVEMDAQRRQLLNELRLLRRTRDRQRQLRQQAPAQQQQQQQQQQLVLAEYGDEAGAAADLQEQQQLQQLEALLDAFLHEQEQAAARGPAAARPPGGTAATLTASLRRQRPAARPAAAGTGASMHASAAAGASCSSTAAGEVQCQQLEGSRDELLQPPQQQELRRGGGQLRLRWRS